MRSYTVILIQWIVWSGFSIAEWLSRHDRLVFKAFMFVVFLQISIFIGKSILHSNLKTGVVTSISLLTYVGIHIVFNQVLY
ncbi:hypothetical protein [Bacillus sp. AP8]|uniref:hypothetical protein n=1 Tax=Bacillus sp. AP8 TaxID=1513284 RepID=UPI00036CBB0C|nr:hypothetical protein [Bacillus sp. AP8]